MLTSVYVASCFFDVCPVFNLNLCNQGEKNKSSKSRHLGKQIYDRGKQKHMYSLVEIKFEEF